jgi:phage protein U
MMKLGDFTFSVELAAYNQFRRNTSYRWPAQERINRIANLQFVGPGEETVTLAGAYFPQVTGRYAVMDDLRELAAQGKPQLLVGGLGHVFGYFVIERVEDSANLFLKNGIPKQVEFSLELKKYGEKADGTV